MISVPSLISPLSFLFFPPRFVSNQTPWSPRDAGFAPTERPGFTLKSRLCINSANCCRRAADAGRVARE